MPRVLPWGGACAPCPALGGGSAPRPSPWPHGLGALLCPGGCLGEEQALEHTRLLRAHGCGCGAGAGLAEQVQG